MSLLLRSPSSLPKVTFRPVSPGARCSGHVRAGLVAAASERFRSWSSQPPRVAGSSFALPCRTTPRIHKRPQLPGAVLPWPSESERLAATTRLCHERTSERLGRHSKAFTPRPDQAAAQLWWRRGAHNCHGALRLGPLVSHRDNGRQCACNCGGGCEAPPEHGFAQAFAPPQGRRGLGSGRQGHAR